MLLCPPSILFRDHRVNVYRYRVRGYHVPAAWRVPMPYIRATLDVELGQTSSSAKTPACTVHGQSTP